MPEYYDKDGNQVLNIYQMYEKQGNKVGFFVVRDSWANIYAKVTSVGGKQQGPLKGKPPYYGNPVVKMDVYNKNGTIQKTDQLLSCPGTYAYKLIEK